MLDGVSTYTGIGGWMTGPWAYDELGRVLCNELRQRDLVIPEDGDCCPLKDEILIDIPGEGIIVVNQHEVRSRGNRRRWLRVLWRVVDNVQGGHLG